VSAYNNLGVRSGKTKPLSQVVNPIFTKGLTLFLPLLYTNFAFSRDHSVPWRSQSTLKCSSNPWLEHPKC